MTGEGEGVIEKCQCDILDSAQLSWLVVEERLGRSNVVRDGDHCSDLEDDG